MYIHFLDKKLEEKFLKLSDTWTPWMSDYFYSIQCKVWNSIYSIYSKSWFDWLDLLYKLCRWLDQNLFPLLFIWTFWMTNTDWSRFNNYYSYNAKVSVDLSSFK